jgi:type II secretory pathway pseudopilin PulG
MSTSAWQTISAAKNPAAKRLNSKARSRRAAAHPASDNPIMFHYGEGATHESMRRALSLIEVVASTLIVGVMAVAALNSLGAATRSSNSIGNRAVALGLADELMAEILQAAYREPSGASGMGPDTGETSGPRSAFDDVDDYQGWNQSPPQYRDGTAMPDRADWRHRVEVTRVGPSDPSQTAGSEQGAKRIRVTIEYRDQVYAELVAVRTDNE